jgi:hypothetical protein
MRGAFLGILAGTALAFTAAQPAAAAALAAGTSINSNGYVIANPTSGDISQATSLDFNTSSGAPSPGTPGVLTSYGAGAGSFAGVSCNNVAGCGSIQDIASLVLGPQSISNFFVLTGGNNVNPIIFNLTGITFIDRSVAGFLNVRASGIFNWTGFDPTPGVFQFSAQGTNVTSFSLSAQAVPEPATWALMLLGFGGIGIAMRRRRRPALAQIA